MRNDPVVMRASDHDRQVVVDRLRTGLEDGRLKMEEYVERMGRAYQAVTYADLATLHADLPAADRVAEQPGPQPARYGRGRPPMRAAPACPRRSRCCGRSGWPPCRSTW